MASNNDPSRWSILWDRMIAPIEESFSGSDPGSGFSEDQPSWSRHSLAVSDLVVEPVRLRPGRSIAIRAVAANHGTGPHPRAELVLHLDAIQIGREGVPELGPGESASFDLETSVEAPGRHSVTVQLEAPESGLVQSDEHLGRSVEIYVAGEELPAPGLHFEPHWDPRRWQPGHAAELSVAVHNPSFADLVRLSATCFMDGEEIATVDVEHLEAGRSFDFDAVWEAVTPGHHLLTAQVKALAQPAQVAFDQIRSWCIIVAGPTNLYDGRVIHQWVSMGPALLDPGFPSGSIGRIDRLAIYPKNPAILYAASPGGGLWRSSDGGMNWVPLGDRLPSLNLRAIAVDPTNDQIVYVTTFKGYYTDDGAQGYFKSLDGGRTWHAFAPKEIADITERISLHYLPGGELMIYAATDKGLRRYTSANPSATSSTLGDWPVIKAGKIQDMAVHPTNPSVVYVSIDNDAVYRTGKGDQTTGQAADWTRLTSGLPALTGADKASRITLDIYRDDPRIVYAAAVSPPGKAGKLGIYRSLDDGDHWTSITDVTLTAYNAFIRVHPRRHQIYYGGVNLHKKYVGTPQGPERRVGGVHDDLKDLVFDPDPQNVDDYYALSDGGIWRCESKVVGSDTTSHRNRDLRVTEFFDLAQSSTNANLMLGGTQDNGTVLYEGKPEWRSLRILSYGDGLYSTLVPKTSQSTRLEDHVLHAQFQFLDQTARSTDGGKDWAEIAKRRSHVDGGWAYLTAHPNNRDLLFSVGDELYMNDAHFMDGLQWIRKGPEGGNVKGGVIRVLVRPEAPFTWVAATYCGQLWYSNQIGTQTGRATWNLLFEHPEAPQSPPFTFKLAARDLAFSPVNADILFVLIDGGQDDYRIWRVDMSNGTVTSMADNFPFKSCVPLCIAGDGYDDETAYVGTQRGVLRWDRSRPTYDRWVAYDTGLPFARINQLLVDSSSSDLIAASRGRGAWRVLTGP